MKTIILFLMMAMYCSCAPSTFSNIHISVYDANSREPIGEVSIKKYKKNKKKLRARTYKTDDKGAVCIPFVSYHFMPVFYFYSNVQKKGYVAQDIFITGSSSGQIRFDSTEAYLDTIYLQPLN
jgi:hypothetical protein